MNIPNLFGAYIKGREYAIDRNWNDRHQYEDVLGKQIRNNQQELNLLADRADFGNMRAQNQFTTDEMARQNEISDIQQQGDVADAWLKANQAVDNWNVYTNLQQYIRENLLDTTQSNLENAKRANRIQEVVRNTYPPEEQGVNIAKVQQETANAQLRELTNPPPTSLFSEVENLINEADAKTNIEINALESQIGELRALKAGGQITPEQQAQLVVYERQLVNAQDTYAKMPLWTRTFIHEKSKPIVDELSALSDKYATSTSFEEKQAIKSEFTKKKMQLQQIVEEIRRSPFIIAPQTPQPTQAQQTQQPTQAQQTPQAQQANNSIKAEDTKAYKNALTAQSQLLLSQDYRNFLLRSGLIDNSGNFIEPKSANMEKARLMFLNTDEGRNWLNRTNKRK